MQRTLEDMSYSEIKISMVLCTIWKHNEWVSVSVCVCVYNVERERERLEIGTSESGGLKCKRGGTFSESTRKHWFRSFRYCGGYFSSLTNDDIEEGLGSSDSIVHARLRERLRNSRHSTSGTLLRFLVLPISFTNTNTNRVSLFLLKITKR